MTKRTSARVQKAKRSLVKELSGMPGFVGAGVSVAASGRYEIVVMVVERGSPVVDAVPPEWEGIPVRTLVGGIPRKF
jgi:hypothetical protein